MLTVVLTVLAIVFGTGGLSWIVDVVRANTRNRLDNAKAEDTIVHTSRELIAELRTEMDRKVTDLTGEVGRIRGHLEAAVAERDHLREIERALRIENTGLRQRIESLEMQVRTLITAAEMAAAHTIVTGPAGPAGAAGLTGAAGLDHV